ncbi:MAG TPA: carboxylating nicotinate-nucleotide diphosphorylase [Gemmataceae bacterium]|jgi:nicotinate-nucleotide pyrophosphorylase (carboxylating)|nr:carboxylating nicotinate-nucleotide diphosphorylase [Gemmataceae bacterium]
MPFTSAETAACRTLVELALREDLGERGDITSEAMIPAELKGRAVFVARKAGVLAGLPAVELVLERFPGVQIQPLLNDGDKLSADKNGRIAVISGSMRSILSAERTALNFLQRLSGVATQTARYVEAVGGLPVQVLDTRKTTPGWRLLEKYAVRIGGGHNHRIGLYDGMLIKDNHLAAMPNPDRLRQIEEALDRARAAHPDMPIEVEVESLEQFWVALERRPDIILLDNMRQEEMRKAVSSRDAEFGGEQKRVLLEASGGVTLETIRAIAETGVDRISVGALTHSAVALDIALDYEG